MDIRYVGIVTRDRPASFATCLASLLDNLETFERSAVRVIVCDDSAPEVAATNRAAAQALGDRHGRAIDVIDRNDRREIAARLDEQLDPHAALAAFALHGDADWRYRIGANRNALLLATIGARVVSLDDDVRCRGVGRGNVDEPAGKDIPTAYDTSEYTFYKSRAELLRTTPLHEADVIGLHETPLGRRIDVPLEPSSRVTRGWTAAQLRDVTRTGAIVRTTQTGLIGDCGMSAPYWLESIGATRDRLIASERRYRAAFISREVLRLVPKPIVSMGTFCMTPCIGLDNTAPLPPFMPVGRSSDSIFGALLRYLMPAAMFGHVPFAIQHWPEPRRRFARSALLDSMLIAHLPDIMLAALAEATAPGWEDAAARYDRLGRHLIAFASLRGGDFVEYLHLHRLATVSRVINRLDALGTAFRWSPPFWARHVTYVIEQLRASCLDGRSVLSPEIPGADPTHAIDRLQRLLAQYGALLRVWPAVRDHAADVVSACLADRHRARVRALA
jgi:hypothetical protein